MKRFLLFLLCLCSQPQLFAEDFDCAQQILDWIRMGQGDSLVARFHPAIRSSLPAPAVDKVWQQLETQAGPFRHQGEWKMEQYDTLLMEQCTLTFDREEVRFVLLTNTEKYIVGFHFNPVSKPFLSSANRPKSEVDYEERDTFVVHGRIKLPATLCLPVHHSGKCPVVVMVHGLGPVDKDGTLGPNKPYREVAHSFATRGIATFRYDKRTFVYGVRSMEIGEMLSFDTEVVDDALEALKLAASFDEVDSSEVFLLGHSLGGMLAPRIAMLSETPLSGVISVAGSARHLQEWLQSQFRYVASIQGSSVAQADSLSNLIYNRMPASYRLFADEYNPVGTARGLDIPMLFLQGGHDFQVTDVDFEIWKKGLADRENVKFIWLKNCDHLLRNIPEMAVPEIYMRPGCIAKEAVDAVVNFIKP